MSNIEALEDEVAVATSVHQIRADSSILGPMNKLLGKFCILLDTIDSQTKSKYL